MKHLKAIRQITLIAIIICLVSISGCFIPYNKDRVSVVSQTAYAIPGAKTSDQYASQYFEILDTDDYGRKLFAISINDDPGIVALCIMQKSDNKYVYYYDNISYLCTDEFNQCTPEQRDTLNQANDWNQEFDKKKMIKRKLVNRYDLSPILERSISWEVLEKAFYKTIRRQDNINETFFAIFDISQAGQEIFLITRSYNASTTGGFDYEPLDYYLMILNADGTYDPENYLVKIDDFKESNALLTEIKENNGWVG